ncbi:2-phospho-L-lactate guanylyltransferase [Natrononativus amylolyticus]|uniref:2-phospho-L-lactate guanylyltransferase n=1 Tax=Natrononativus amylolyticus TaxID=2963434 RepID=UPI0020CCF92D|nr:2-phospho-L-lactate guanylyltransferase [Natrononativus amylolyticus]
MQVVVPFAVDAPKTRLAPVLSPAERERFARAMLEDVLTAIDDTRGEPTVLSTAPVDLEADVRVDERPLSEAVNGVLEAATGPVAVVMADLALATSDALEALFAADGEVVVAPGRGGGTNALVVRHPEFRVDYHGASYLDHRAVADGIGARLETVDSFRLATDVDEPADLVEVVLHGGSRSRAFLEEAGFRLETTGGRVGVSRTETARVDDPGPK